MPKVKCDCCLENTDIEHSDCILDSKYIEDDKLFAKCPKPVKDIRRHIKKRNNIR